MKTCDFLERLRRVYWMGKGELCDDFEDFVVQGIEVETKMTVISFLSLFFCLFWHWKFSGICCFPCRWFLLLLGLAIVKKFAVKLKWLSLESLQSGPRRRNVLNRSTQLRDGANFSALERYVEASKEIISVADVGFGTSMLMGSF